MKGKKNIEQKHLVDYALGLTKADDNQTIEQELTKDKALRDELDQITASLADYAMDSAPKAPAHLKNAIKAELGLDTAERKTIQMEPKKESQAATPSSGNSSYKWYAFAASIALVISLAYNVMLNKDLQTANLTIAGLQESATELAHQDEILRTVYDETEHTLAFVRHEKSHMVRMNGTDYMPEGMATVVWNEQTQEVMVDINNMPKAPDGHQHQLWALVDGQPVDLGVFDVVGVEKMQKMKSISKADAFAVTIELTGGSPTPTLERLCVIGNV